VKDHRDKISTLQEGICFMYHTVRRQNRVRLQLVRFPLHSTLLVMDFLACGLRSSCHPEGNIFHHVSPICFTAGDVASIWILTSIHAVKQTSSDVRMYSNNKNKCYVTAEVLVPSHVTNVRVRTALRWMQWLLRTGCSWQVVWRSNQH
jgi:hypothetical protein